MCSDSSQGDDAPHREPRAGRSASGRPAVVGEVLFDIFPDGTRVLGGAPFNVAWHLQAFGLRPLLITRVGNDQEGEEIAEAMRLWDMDLAGLQTDNEAPTGRVRVDIDGGEPSFTIMPDQAYDNLERDETVSVIEAHVTSLVYHGSLIARSTRSRSAVRAVRALVALPAFVDVNLRAPWWSDSVVGSLLEGARWVKLNRDELARLIGIPENAEFDLAAAARELRRRRGVGQVIVTRGAAGAWASQGDGAVEGLPPATPAIVDTVGAGDAFSAVWIAGSIHGWSSQRTLTRALSFAADVCTYRGAVTHDRSLYQRHLESWQDS